MCSKAKVHWLRRRQDTLEKQCHPRNTPWCALESQGCCDSWFQGWGTIAPRGGGVSPFFQPPPPPKGVGLFCRGANFSKHGNDSGTYVKDTLVPGHFRLFSVTAPHQGLPLPYNGKSSLLRVCVKSPRNMPVHVPLCGRHIWQKNKNPILPRRCHKVTAQKSPFFVKPPPPPGFGGLMRPPPPLLAVQFSTRPATPGRTAGRKKLSVLASLLHGPTTHPQQCTRSSYPQSSSAFRTPTMAPQ